jgi:type VI secretion system protein ImpH
MRSIANNPQSPDAPAGPVARLTSRGWEFDFFQAVWLLERAFGTTSRVGGQGPVATESIQFRPDVSLGFPAADVRNIISTKAPDGTVRHIVEVTFLGLYGVATPLPPHYAVQILRSVEGTGTEEQPICQEQDEAEQASPTPARDFLDILHHRLTSLFYRAWTKYRYHVTFGAPGSDVITDYLIRLIGNDPTWDENALGIEPLRMIRYAGALTQRPRSAVTLEGILVDYWKGLPAQVYQGIGRWITLKPVDLNRLGRVNCRLGVDLTVGEQTYDLTGAFRVTLGPMGWDEYLTLIPGSRGMSRTSGLIRLFETDPLAFGVELKLRASEIPEMTLSSDNRAARLGFTSWVRTDQMPETAVTFEVES